MVYGHEMEIDEEVLPVYDPNEGGYCEDRCLRCKGKPVRRCNRCMIQMREDIGRTGAYGVWARDGNR